LINILFNSSVIYYYYNLLISATLVTVQTLKDIYDMDSQNCTVKLLLPTSTS